MKKFNIILTCVLGIALMFMFSFQVNAVNKTEGKTRLIHDQIVVKFADNATVEFKSNLKGRYGLTKIKNSLKKNAFVVYRHGNPQSIMKQIAAEPGVVSVEQNAYAYAFSVPNDPYYNPYQWNFTRIGMEDAWDLSTGSGTVVAIVDSGVRQSLPDLAGTNFTAGYDFVNGDNDPDDDNGHGSHVAGTVAQTTNNSLGCAGIAYNATIMPVKVLNKRGSGSLTDIADGITFAVDNGADVINLSLGGPSTLSVLEDAINYAWNNNVVVICAAGNDSSSASFYPAAYTNSISVSATGGNDALASYSNYGATIDICAPGGDSGDYNGDGYDDMILQNTFVRKSTGYYFFSGTSMAAPHVAAVAALVKSANFSLTNAQIRNILESTAEDLGTSGWDQYFGHGLLDAYAAVDAAN